MKRALIAASMLMLGGCTNLSAVSSISARLSSASSDWDDVTEEFSASCTREQTINPVLTNCNLEREASAGLGSANAVLANYFDALAHAATETNFSIEPGLQDVTTSVSQIPGVNAGQVEAVSGLLGLLANLAGRALREKTLRDLIDRGGPPARTVVSGLNSLVVARLVVRLQTEKVQLTSKFSGWIAEQRDAVGSNPSELCTNSRPSGFTGPGYLLSLEYCRRVALIDHRIAAIDDYKRSLIAADAALAELQSSKSRLKTKGLAKQLFAIGLELDKRLTAVRKAFA